MTGQAAEEEARAAAGRAGVRITLLHDRAGCARGAELLSTIWGTDEAVVSKDVLRALAHSGNYVAGAFLPPDRLAGISVGFLGRAAGGWYLHSHISGVAGDVRDRGIGFALKLHQRAWCLDLGLDRVEWTFDPLIRRNAYFNLSRLGARVTGYERDFYGPMGDQVNAGDETDRAVVEWSLLGERAADGGGPPRGAPILRDRGDGWPEQAGGAGSQWLRAWIPPDIVELRHHHPEQARAWRRALRETFGSAIDAGYVACGMTRSGWYQLEKRDSTP